MDFIRFLSFRLASNICKLDPPKQSTPLRISFIMSLISNAVSRSINIFYEIHFIFWLSVSLPHLPYFSCSIFRCLLFFFFHFLNFISFHFLLLLLHLRWCIYLMFRNFADVPDIVCQEYAVPHNMQDLIPKIPGGYVSIRNTPPSLNNMVFPKPPPVPPPPEKYYATTAICKTATSMATTAGNNIHTTNTMPLSSAQPTATTNLLSSYNDTDAASTDDDLQQLNEFPRHSLVIVEKLGSGAFGELHLCETKGLR